MAAKKTSTRKPAGPGGGVHFGWRPDLPDHRDFPYAAMRQALEQPLTLPPKADLRPASPPIYDQGHLGSCTANAIAGAFEFDRMKQKLSDFMPSRLFIYWNERDMEGTTSDDAGAFIRDGIKSIGTRGVCKEADWPYDIAKFAARPPKRCYKTALKYKAVSYFRLNNANLDELRTCLAAGFPFIFGFTVYPSFFNADQNAGIVSMPGPETTVGGHAVVAVGYDDARQLFTIRNSWGTGKGDKGYYYMPYQYLTTTALSDDFWTVRLVSTAAVAPV